MKPSNNPAGNRASLERLTPEQRRLARLRAAATKRRQLEMEFGIPFELAARLRRKYYLEGYDRGYRSGAAARDAVDRLSAPGHSASVGSQQPA